ncbi:Aste57867_56 [Aphanomyces stellatus]|uniref:Aste57867_56 protein n=1 Tax=Aphanomyces stellatus TaxID=120398 RepID=A0A485K1M6_9STRA|nr:hypothetical protein As57867_000056 [Aphanomyces stellatus]VFT77282.1 Aste57867_56 [Aphanomyces stellatus]
MNPAEETRMRPSTPRPSSTRPPKFHSKLKQTISESKMLQILDHKLDENASNQDDDGGDELVSDSTMIAVEEHPQEEEGFDRRGVLHTIRSIHKQTHGGGISHRSS